MMATLLGYLSLLLALVNGCGTEVGNGNRHDPQKEPMGATTGEFLESMPGEAIIERDENPYLEEAGVETLLELIPRLLMNGCAMPFTEDPEEVSLWVISEAMANEEVTGRHLWLQKSGTKWTLCYLYTTLEASAKTYRFDAKKQSVELLDKGSKEELELAECKGITSVDGNSIDNAKDVTLSDKGVWLFRWEYQDKDEEKLSQLSFYERSEPGELFEEQIKLQRITK